VDDTDSNWFGPDTATFGDRVAGAREHAGMTQTQLAKRLGIKKATLRAWEEDLSEPRANKLAMLAGLVNVSIVWLLTGEGDGMPGPPDIPSDRELADIVAELHAIRGEMRTLMERTGRTEKRLRLHMGRLEA
jgi:transcriptional regulator with XRE-family HTH domain